MEGTPTIILSKLNKKTKKIAFVHTDCSKGGTFDRMFKTKEKCIKCYRSFDEVCFVSEDTKNAFEKKYERSRKNVVVHNVLNLMEIKEKSECKIDDYSKTSNYRFIVVGRLSAPKNIMRVLEAALELQKKYSFEIKILGTGEEYDLLNSFKKSNAIECVDFLGYRQNPYPYIKQSDMLICSSNFEGYSTVCCEAIYLGVPVLTTNCSGMKEILKDGRYGLIVENDTRSFIDGFERIIKNPGIIDRFRKNILMDITDSSFSNLTQYEQLFERVLKDI